jgi:tRNA pseudouridine55 synthase
MTALPTKPSGALIVDKPSGPTSFAIIGAVRRLFRTKKVGHCGTLDPMASGVLVVVLGEATKLAGVLTGADKSYVARISFGASTDTLDAEGQTTDSQPLDVGWAARVDLEPILKLERDRREQVPPQFSAIKREGRRAYALARRGETQDLPARPVRVRRLEAKRFDDTNLVLELEVSKGYYVRSLARDLCAALGVRGHLSELRRTRSGCFTEAEAVAWPASSPPALITVEECASRALTRVELTAEGAHKARLGHKLTSTHFATTPPDTTAAWFSPQGRLVALGWRDGDLFRVSRGFVIDDEPDA